MGHSFHVSDMGSGLSTQEPKSFLLFPSVSVVIDKQLWPMWIMPGELLVCFHFAVSVTVTNLTLRSRISWQLN